MNFGLGSVGTGRASVSLQDAYVRYKPGAIGLQAGQFKTPFTREFITSLADSRPPTGRPPSTPWRRNATSASWPTTPSARTATALLGVFNGEGQNITGNADSTLLIVPGRPAAPSPSDPRGEHRRLRWRQHARSGWTCRSTISAPRSAAEYLTQRRDMPSGRQGMVRAGAYRVVPWLQLVFKQEDFRRSAICPTSGITRLPGASTSIFRAGRSD